MTVYKIYCITNSITGKQYVGYTSESIHRRWMRHQFCPNASQKKLAEIYKIDASHISNIVNRKTWKHI